MSVVLQRARGEHRSMISASVRARDSQVVPLPVYEQAAREGGQVRPERYCAQARTRALGRNVCDLSEAPRDREEHERVVHERYRLNDRDRVVVHRKYLLAVRRWADRAAHKPERDEDCGHHEP